MDQKIHYKNHLQTYLTPKNLISIKLIFWRLCEFWHILRIKVVFFSMEYRFQKALMLLTTHAPKTPSKMTFTRFMIRLFGIEFFSIDWVKVSIQWVKMLSFQKEKTYHHDSSMHRNEYGKENSLNWIPFASKYTWDHIFILHSGNSFTHILQIS